MTEPRRRPYPFDINVGGTGMMLGKTQPGQPKLVSKKTADLSQVAPTSFEYGALNPLREKTHPYRGLQLGMGLKQQENFNDQRYTSCLLMDPSVWPIPKGPDITLNTPVTTDSTNGVRKFVELGGVLYSACGRYFLKRASEVSWTVAKDFGAGVNILDAIVFQSNFDGTARVFVALSTGVAQYSTDGTTFTAMGTFTALAFAVVGREFWWATDTNLLRKLDTNANPTVEANYTATQFRAGDKSSSITALAVTAAGTLLILKTDGIYTLDGAGDDHNLYPFLKFAPDPDNGRYWGQFANDLHTTYNGSHFRLSSDLVLDPVGPERLINNDSVVRGAVTAFAGVGTLFAHAGLWNGDTGKGYLMKFGGYIQGRNPDTSTGFLLKFGGFSSSATDAEPVRIDSWHGSLSQEFSSKITALFVSSIGAVAGHTRTYIGFADGSVAWFGNSCVPNPAACSTYRFATVDGTIDFPLWHGLLHADVKTLRSATVTGTQIDASNYYQLNYKTDPGSGSFTAFNTNFNSPVREKANFPSNTTTVLAAFRIIAHSTANTTCPLLTGLAIHHALRLDRIMVYEGDVLCAESLIKRDSTPMRLGRTKIRSALQSAVDAAGSTTVFLPDESSQQLSFIDYQEALAFDEVGKQWTASLHFQALDFSTNTVYGLLSRLRPYKLADLRNFTLNQLRSL